VCLDPRHHLTLGALVPGRSAALPPTFLGKSLSAGVRHPQLDEAETSPSHALAITLDALPEGAGLSHDM
jgi:hypothetical protein